MASHGLQRDFGRELGIGDDVEQRAPFAKLPILGQRAPRLTHEPHRRAFDRFAARRADEQRLHAA
jgi:hypothetical protein